VCALALRRGVLLWSLRKEARAPDIFIDMIGKYYP